MSQFFVYLFVLLTIVSGSRAAKVQECEVCESVINKLRKLLPDDATPDEIEIEFKRFCKTATGKDEKFVKLLFFSNKFPF